jgi:hypothetical protein
MADQSAARLQTSVDRARAQSHRLLHKCTGELRKLQTLRKYRDESFEAGTDISDHGVIDWQSIQQGLHRAFMAGHRRRKLTDMAEIEAILDAPFPPPAPVAESTPLQSGSFCKNDDNDHKNGTAPSQTPRNATCPCGSGLKFKRCCIRREARHAAVALQGA